MQIVYLCALIYLSMYIYIYIYLSPNQDSTRQALQGMLTMCIDIYIYVYLYTHIYVCVYIYIHDYVYIIYIYIYLYILLVCIFIHILCSHVCACAYIYIYINTYSETQGAKTMIYMSYANIQKAHLQQLKIHTDVVFVILLPLHGFLLDWFSSLLLGLQIRICI